MSPVKFLFTFLFISIILWLLFISASKFVAWTLSRILKASVAFKVSGWKCLRDVTIKFEKGAVESVCVGEIRFSLRQSLVKLGFGFMSRDPKLQLLISDIEIVTRASNKNAKRSESHKSRRPRSNPGRGKWMVVANMARFLSISVTDLIVKTPKAAVEVKDLGVEISKDGGTKPCILVKLQLVPVVVHLGDPRISFDQSSSFSSGESFTSGQTCFAAIDKASAPFFCEEFHLSSEFGHDREAGIVVKNVDISVGEISLNLDEELIPGKKSSDTQVDEFLQSSIEHTIAKKQENKQSPLLAVTKYTSFIPEKVSLALPKLNVRFVHKEHYIVMENNIMGIQLKSVKSRFVEDIGESTRLDLQLEFSEIHLLKEAENSMVDILKLAVISSVYIPLQPTSPIRCEIDVKLGGTQCNLFMERLNPLMKLSSSKKKKMVLRDENANPVAVQSSSSKAIMWTCTVSAPEMTIVLFNLSGLPIYHGFSQSSHVFANNISSTGTAVHLELGELNLHMADEYQESLRESLFGVETNTGSLLHIAKISLDWGKKDRESQSPQEDSCKFILVLAVDVTGMGVNLTFKRVQSLLSTALLFKALLKTPSPSPSLKTSTQSRAGRSTKPSGKGIRLVKFNLERCSVNLSSEVGLENEVIEDPKKVNYGSQGGRVTFSVLADGTPRTAKIASTVSNEHKMVKCVVGLDIFHFSLCLNKEKQSTQLELERARSVYQEYLEDNSTPRTKVTLFDMQNAKFVRRAGGLKEIAVCSLFSATDITFRWEPDVHLSLVDLGLRMKLLIDNQKRQSQEDKLMKGNNAHTKEESVGVGSLESEKNKKKKESLFAIDVEMLTLTGEAGDGVEAMIQVQSIFSENARIGVLLEGLMLSFNSAKVFKSGRMQISRIPHAPKDSGGAKWDWVVQAFDIQIIMPYRLQLRALDDSIEEMLRALKLVTCAKTKAIFPFKEDGGKPKKPSSSSSKIGRVKLYIRKLSADIEEEPLQGWLDQHYRLMKNEARELAVRLSLLDAVTTAKSSAVGDTDDSVHEVGGEEIHVHDASSIEKLKEEIYKQSFRSYYRACKSLVTTDGSGASCQDGFQSGFKLSTSRTSLFSITATELDLSLSAIEGGEAGMIDFVQKLDPVALEYKIPFSRLYGSNINMQTGSLAIQLRDYTYPLLAGTSGKCEGRVVLAQQATPFQPQMLHDVYIGRWRKVQMYRSLSGTTPPMKTYLDLPLSFQKGEISYGVGFEPSFADLSYAFTVALRRANLSVRNPNASNNITPPKKEKSLPWWDEMRNYIHGKTTLCFSESTFNILATTDPYEKSDKLQIASGHMELRHSDGRIHVSAKDFKMFTSSLENLLRNSTVKPPAGTCGAFLVAPSFTLEVTMDWECESGKPLNHFLFALPSEGVTRDKIYDPFRSTSLSLRWNFSLRPIPSSNGFVAFDAALHDLSKLENDSISSPTLNVGPHDFAWLIKFWYLNYIPPHKLRYFSRWPRFGVPRVPRSGNLSLDKVMTEFMFRIDSTPTCLRHMSLDDNDPAKGLTFKMTKLKFEMCYSRGKQKYTFESKRDILDLVYQGLDLHMPKVFLNKDDCTSVIKVVQMTRKSSKSSSTDRAVNENLGNGKGSTERHRDDGFLLSSDYFTIRRQSPKADPTRLLAWQEAGRRNLEMTYVRSEFENGSESDEQARSDPSEDDGYNVVIADNCRRIFVYGLKLLWTIENRNAVWSWVGELSKAFAPSKPSPSRQYAQRKLHEETQLQNKNESQSFQEDASSKNPSVGQGASSSKQKEDPSHVTNSTKLHSQSFGAIDKHGFDDSDEEGTRRFMVNVIEPQFNLHSEDANGRFLLAAVSGRVLARSFHAVLNVGIEMIKQALGSGEVNNPELTWNRMELSVMLERVQAHVAPTDVDPGAGLQWLPKIRRSSPKVKRTGALLERVFMPCDMYFRYTRHKGGTTDLKVKPLKELAFNSQNITATMTSRQFQVMLDVLTNLLFARLPKSRRSSLPKSAEDDEDIEEEADEVVPDGVEEVEIERVNLEQKERARSLLFDDIRNLSILPDASGDVSSEKEGNLWMITCGRSTLVQRLKKELVNAQKSRKMAAASLRMAMQKAAQLRLMEKEKNKSPSCAMRISLQINKVVWGMLVDGKSFAEAEINDMIYDFDRDYKDVGLARFTTKYFVVRNCLPNAKSDMLLSAWNPPPEWGKKVMLRVDAKQGAPKDGNSPIELFQVDIYPLKIHLTETMYRMMWEYFFPEEEQDSQRRQEVWKVSTTAGLRRAKKGSTVNEASASTSHSTKESDGSSRSSAYTVALTSSIHGDSMHASKMMLQQNAKSSTAPELGRSSSFERRCEESVAESITNELMLQLQPSKNEPIGSLEVQQDNESVKSKSKDSKTAKSARSSHEDKKLGKPGDEKRSRPRVMREFHNIKISQVELLVTYEGSRFAVSDLRLLMDTFHRLGFTGTWRRLFSRVKKHIIWGVLKSVTGMQGKKFKDKLHGQGKEAGSLSGIHSRDLNLSDSDGGGGGLEQVEVPITWPKRPPEGAGDGFVTSIRGLFHSQRRKAKAFVLRTMRGEGENDQMAAAAGGGGGGEWSESDTEYSPFARQLTITKARKLIRRHTKKFRSKKGIIISPHSQQQQRIVIDSSLPSSPIETTPYETNSSSGSGSDPYEDFLEYQHQQKSLPPPPQTS